MGLFSKIQKFHEAGEGANESYVEDFGLPVRSLYTAADLVRLALLIEIATTRNL